VWNCRGHFEFLIIRARYSYDSIVFVHILHQVISFCVNTWDWRSLRLKPTKKTNQGMQTLLLIILRGYNFEKMRLFGDNGTKSNFDLHSFTLFGSTYDHSTLIKIKVVNKQLISNFRECASLLRTMKCVSTSIYLLKPLTPYSIYPSILVCWGLTWRFQRLQFQGLRVLHNNAQAAQQKVQSTGIDTKSFCIYLLRYLQ